jgi:uroporphyrinogen decarboxylase
VHSHGMQILLHSCGDIWEIIPDLIAIGFDVLNLEQPLLFGTPAQNGIDRLAEHFGGRVCFCTNVDSQRTLITGTRAEVVQEVQHIIRALARPEGGLIPLADCGQDQHTTLSENIAVMADAFEQYAYRTTL